jgi:hypothetical protein
MSLTFGDISFWVLFIQKVQQHATLVNIWLSSEKVFTSYPATTRRKEIKI